MAGPRRDGADGPFPDGTSDVSPLFTASDFDDSSFSRVQVPSHLETAGLLARST